MTKIYKINPDDIDLPSIKECAELIKKGKLVVFPTETVYGLGANALDDDAVEKIFKAKGRPNDNPLIVHVSDYEMLDLIVYKIPEKAKLLIKKFWPGPLTLIVRKKHLIPENVTCHLPTIAVRMPSHPIALELIRQADLPIAAPSANISGLPSCTLPSHVIDDMKGKVDAIIEGGDCDFGLESTVIDVTKEPAVLLRPGAITLEQLEKVIGKVIIADPDAKKPSCPGMKYRHYAPNTPLLLAAADTEEGITAKIESKSRELISEGKKVAIIGSDELLAELPKEITDNVDFTAICSRKDLKPLAARIFKVLRDLDKQGFDYMLIGSWPEKGIGRAIMNRLRKASSEIM